MPYFFIYSFIYLYIYLFAYSFIYLFIYLFICLFTYGTKLLPSLRKSKEWFEKKTIFKNTKRKSSVFKKTPFTEINGITLGPQGVNITIFGVYERRPT